MQWEIRPVTKKDYQALLDVWEASVRATHNFITEADIQYFKPLILKQYFDLVDLFCTRDIDGQILGFLGVANGKIEMLFIHPDWMGQGIGKRLLVHAIYRQKATEVDVNEQNEQAVRFYLYMGFTVISRSEVDNLGKPYPLLHMVYELDAVGFRPATERDFSKVMDMMTEFNAIDGYPFQLATTERNLRIFLCDQNLGRIWIIHAGGHICGYVVLTFGFSFEYQGRDAFIDELFVKRAHRGRGIGKVALEYVIKQAKLLGINALHLEVEKHNERAINLYTHQGFEFGRRRLLTKII